MIAVLSRRISMRVGQCEWDPSRGRSDCVHACQCDLQGTPGHGSRREADTDCVCAEAKVNSDLCCMGAGIVMTSLPSLRTLGTIQVQHGPVVCCQTFIEHNVDLLLAEVSCCKSRSPL